MDKLSILEQSILKQVKFDHNGDLQKSWIAVYGSVDEAAKALLYLVRNGVISFPFSNQYLPSAEIMFQNIIDYQPNIIYGPYRSFYPDKTFKGESVRVKSGFDLHQSIDGITDLFIEDVRIKSKKVYAKQSTYECWMDNDCLLKILKTLLTDPSLKDLTPKDFREAIYLNSPEAGLFKISSAKGVLEILNPGNKWLDFSAGWGDRLITAMACGFEYIGFDPNTELYPGHTQMIESFYNEFSKEGIHKIYYQPFETVDVDNLIKLHGYFDLCFTSPPYFDLEIYNQGPNQSIVKYPRFQDWLTKFLFTALEKAWRLLSPQGILAIHIEDVKGGKIVEPMKEFVKQLDNSQYLGVIGIEGEAGKVRPVWVWKKT